MLGWADPIPPAATSFPASPIGPCFQHLLHHLGERPGPELWGQKVLKIDFFLKRHKKGRVCPGAHNRGREVDRWRNGPGLGCCQISAHYGQGPAWVLEEPGPLVSVGPAEPTVIFLVLMGVHSFGVRGYNMFILRPLTQYMESSSPSIPLPDFSCLFLFTLLCLPLFSLVYFHSPG